MCITLDPENCMKIFEDASPHAGWARFDDHDATLDRTLGSPTAPVPTPHPSAASLQSPGTSCKSAMCVSILLAAKERLLGLLQDLAAVFVDLGLVHVLVLPRGTKGGCEKVLNAGGVGDARVAEDAVVHLLRRSD